MKRILLIITLVTVCFTVQSQEYKNSIGVRGTYAFGITGKHVFQENKAIEGIVTFGYGGFNITGLYEIHAPAFDVNRLYWYYGGGAHIGQIGAGHPFLDREEGTFLLGIDGIVGLEYDIEEIPITISLDWKPTISFTGYGSGLWGGLSFRYTF
jgi:hypothetical protein